MNIRLPNLKLPNWLERQQNSILSAAMIITVANIISTLSGLLRQRILIDVYFHSAASQQAYEALLVAFQIPDMMFQLIILGAISAAFIPVFTQMRKKNAQSAFEMSSIVMNVLLMVFVAISILVYVYAEPLTAVRTGSEFTQEQVIIAANLTRIMLIAQVFFAISSFFSGMLQSFQRFVIPSLAPIFYNVGIVVGVYLLAPQLGIYAAGVGVIIGAFLHMIIQLPLGLKLGFRFKQSFNIKHEGVKDIFKLTPPRLLTLGVSEVENLALAFFATSLGNLAFVVIRLAMTLMTIPIRLFGVPIGQASLPFLSEESDQAELTRFKELVLQSLNQISFLALPASVLLLILRIPIVRIAFGASDFPWETTVETSWVLALLAFSIAAQALTQLLIRAFHALKDTKTPFYVTLITVVINIGFYYVSVFKTNWGVFGMAAGIVVAAVLELIFLLVVMDKRINAFRSKAFWLPQLKMLSASFLMAVFLYLPFKILDEVVFDTSRTIELIALTITTSTIGMMVYIFFSAIFEVKELQFLTNMLSTFSPKLKWMSKTKEVIMETPVEGDEV